MLIYDCNINLQASLKRLGTLTQEKNFQNTRVYKELIKKKLIRQKGWQLTAETKLQPRNSATVCQAPDAHVAQNWDSGKSPIFRRCHKCQKALMASLRDSTKYSDPKDHNQSGQNIISSCWLQKWHKTKEKKTMRFQCKYQGSHSKIFTLG